MKRRADAGERADKRAAATIEAAGWTLAFSFAANGLKRFVASKRVVLEDHSVTTLFESSYTLVDVANQVTRREREESRA